MDQRESHWIGRGDTDIIQRLCNRRFGLGADGLILLQNCPGYDFEMVYFNADGRESTMCGNGGRCIAAFASDLGIFREHCRFMAIDGEHEAKLRPEVVHSPVVIGAMPGFWVELKMIDVQKVERQNDAYILNTGSPHYVEFKADIQDLDIVAEGRKVRYSDTWKKAGINVNFVSLDTPGLQVRTYERGVEDETYACGTGVTATAIASFLHAGKHSGDANIPVQAKGGGLSVRFHANGDGSFSNIWLCGPAVRVFEGVINHVD